MHNTILVAHALIKTALHDSEKVTPTVLRHVISVLDALDERIISQFPQDVQNQDAPMRRPLRSPTARKP